MVSIRSLARQTAIKVNRPCWQLMQTVMASETVNAFTVITPPGRGAVATIAVRGELSRVDRLFEAANEIPLSRQPINRIVFGHWRSTDEDIVTCRSSSTVEIHCHGGDAAVDRICSDLANVGFRNTTADSADAGMPRIEAQVSAELVSATTFKAAALLLRQREILPKFLNRMQSCSEAEFGRRLDVLLKHADFGLRLSRGWTIAIVGRPNVGKSSLLNAIVGYSRSIVFDQPGTTRDVVSAETACDGWPVRFLDTAGLRETADRIESAGIGKARKQSEQADLVLLVLDASQPLIDADRRLMSEFEAAIVVVNKSDLRAEWLVPPAMRAVSSRTGAGIRELISMITGALIPEIPSSDLPLLVNQQQVAAVQQASELFRNTGCESARKQLRQMAEEH